MSNAPRHNLTHSGPWTWTWGSALLLSALLVSPVGADALLHLLHWHGPQSVVVSERDAPRRKSEDDPAPSLVQVSQDDDTAVEPAAASMVSLTVAVTVTSPAIAAFHRESASTPNYPARPVLLPRAVARRDASPRAPPV